MTPWDGVCGQFHYLHSDGLLIDGKGSIFYMNAEGVPLLYSCDLENDPDFMENARAEVKSVPTWKQYERETA